MKRQIILIHGGEAFDSYDEYIEYLKNKEMDLDRLRQKGWRENLSGGLGEDCEVLSPKMPNPTNARYFEWEIVFSKLLPLLQDDVILVGHSLGGIFLAKYLSLNDVPCKVAGTFLVAAPFVDKDYPLQDFDLPSSLEGLERRSGKLHLYHSEDDFVVPYAHVDKYKERLSGAVVRRFKDREHFQGQELPELIEDIRNLL